MTDRELLHAIAHRLQTLIMAANDLGHFVDSLATEAERSETRIRELAGAPIQQAAANGTQGKRRGRPPREAHAQTQSPLAPEVLPCMPDETIRQEALQS
jgi:hypothetical protein